MATWKDLVAFIRTEYRVVEETRDEINIYVEFEDERSQLIWLSREVLDGREEWVQIASPFAMAGQVNLNAVLKEIGETTVVGGAAIMGEHVVLRHSLPLSNLDINEFVDPLALLAGTVDSLEETFSGGDAF
ncbi:hypothetical protein GCM10010174_82880 [Kutzneria viridogrisea]|uniref:YbjN domain-containing protein n=2 Tax=Kutzneria TaxID=43356 RepID=W5WPU6_9PSEU|nr:hypothetical protein [Kutzneria albida]AHI00180.1 hypothetical protein KALB_6821 [Kutzneria albida DSM 43870]MBA8925357.1 hypothetical protein [Kutzneria viridogrisea]